MKVLSIDELKDLIHYRAEPCISLYAPMKRAGKEVRQNQIRYKNLLSNAEKSLKEIGFRSIQIKDILAPAAKLIDNTPFWNNQGDGLAVFISPEDFRVYRLPVAFNELAVVAGRYHLKQLLPIFSGEQHYFVLAIGQKDIRVYRGSEFGLVQLEIEGMPESIDDITKYDDSEKQLQYHTGTSSGKKGRRDAVFHGQGIGGDDTRQKKDILRYFREIDNKLPGYIKHGNAPIVLAAVESLHGIYKEANSSPMLLDEGLRVNPFDFDDRELHERIWEIVSPILDRKKDEELEKYHEMKSKGKASNKIEDILTTAQAGGIDTLFFEEGYQRWGSYRPKEGKLDLHEKAKPGDDDLIDLAAVMTMENHGSVFALSADKMPESANLAAVYRF